MASNLIVQSIALDDDGNRVQVGVENDKIVLKKESSERQRQGESSSNAPLRALPMRLNATTVTESVFSSDTLSLPDGIDEFLKRNNLNGCLHRYMTASCTTVERRSIEAPRIGHPFVDALLFAHENGLSFTFTPGHWWELAAAGISSYLQENDATVNALATRRYDCTGASDGRFRLCMSDFGGTSTLPSVYHPHVWESIRKQLASANKTMVDMASHLWIERDHSVGGVEGGSVTDRDTLDLEQRQREASVLDLRTESTKMQPVNVISERVALPHLAMPENTSTSAAVARGEERKGLTMVHFQGALQEWCDLLTALHCISRYPPFLSWARRLMWLTYHVVLYYYKFTKKSERPPLDTDLLDFISVHCAEQKKPLDVFRNFFFPHRNETSGVVERLSGFFSFLFPYECGYLQVTADSCHDEVRQFARGLRDFSPLNYGIDVAEFVNRVSAFDSIITTPSVNVMVRCYAGSIGWILHEKQRSVEVMGVSFAVFNDLSVRVLVPEPTSDDMRRQTFDDEQRMLNEHVDQFVSQDISDFTRRCGAVDDLMFALNVCNGDTVRLEEYAAYKRQENVMLWPESLEMMLDWTADLCECGDARCECEERKAGVDVAAVEKREEVVTMKKKTALPKQKKKTAPKQKKTTQKTTTTLPKQKTTTLPKQKKTALPKQKKTTQKPKMLPKQKTPPMVPPKKTERVKTKKTVPVVPPKKTAQQKKSVSNVGSSNNDTKKATSSQCTEIASDSIEKLRSEIKSYQKMINNRTEEVQRAQMLAQYRLNLLNDVQKSVQEQFLIMRGKDKIIEEQNAVMEEQLEMLRNNARPVEKNNNTEYDGGWKIVARCKKKKKNSVSEQMVAHDVQNFMNRIFSSSSNNEINDINNSLAEVYRARSVSVKEKESRRKSNDVRGEAKEFNSTEQQKEQQCIAERRESALGFKLIPRRSMNTMDAVIGFVQRCRHPATWSRLRSRHHCVAHRDAEMAPLYSTNYYDSVVERSEHWSLHSLLVAISDRAIQCVECAAQPQSAVLVATARANRMLLPPLPQFVRALYDTLTNANIDDDRAAFRSCFVCRRAFSNDHYRIALALGGVGHDGTVHGRIVLHCADNGERCLESIRKRFQARSGHRHLAAGISFSVRSYHNLGGDVVVRVHCDEHDDEHIQSPHDLIMHIPRASDAKRALVSFVFDPRFNRPMALIEQQ